MMDGLGLAETTPGPLILVTEFVGFLAGFKTAGLIYGILERQSLYGQHLYPAFYGFLLERLTLIG